MAINFGKPSNLVQVGFFGNILEWYDFSIYAYLALTIGQLFFSDSNKHTALIKAFSLFAVSYLVRPIGSLFFGFLADKKGRSLAMKASLIMMALPTALIAIIPTYKQAGVLATILLIILRIFQGFAAGGELPISNCYIYESSPKERRVFYCSFIAASSMLGVLLGSLVVSLLHIFFTKQLILDWAWRLPFFIGLITVFFVYQLRKKIKEPSTKRNKIKSTKEHIINHKWPLIQVILLNIFISISFYLLFVWMPSYLHVYLHISSREAFLSATISLITLIILTLTFSYHSEKIGRRTAAAAGIILIIMLSYPLFFFLNTKMFLVTTMIQILFAVFLGLIDSVNMEIMASRFTSEFRGRGVSISFTLATSIFGGITPVACSYIIFKTGNSISPVLLLIGAGLIALPAAIKLDK